MRIVDLALILIKNTVCFVFHVRLVVSGAR